MAEINPNTVKPLYPDKYYVYALCKPNGESVGILAKEFGITTSSLRDIFVGNSMKGLFTNYDEFPERYKNRKNKGKWLEDKIY